MISISDAAAQKLKDIFKEDGRAEPSLRVVATAGPNGTAQYNLSLEGPPRGDDSIIDSNGIQVVVDSDSLPLLDGSEIDYEKGLMQSAFVINNPNIKAQGSGCACGGICNCGGH